MNQRYMLKQPTLRPSDLVVACQLAITHGAHFANIADATGISTGECHNAVRRLRLARLLLIDERRPATESLHEFMVHGAPFAFPPALGPEIVGVPTGHASPPFQGVVESSELVVWAHADGAVRGQSLVPLFPGAAALPGRNQALYELLAIADALRVGTTRVRNIAAELLAARLTAARQ
jgi:hypothetical protein